MAGLDKVQKKNLVSHSHIMILSVSHNVPASLTPSPLSHITQNTVKLLGTVS